MLPSLGRKFLRSSCAQFVKMSVCVQKLNPILGENTWEWQDENYDYHQEIARSSFADMLHDTERNQKYHDALKLAIEKMHASGKKAKVLDIGTGTGLLSMMAVQCGADSVVACEAFPPMSACAQQVVNLNDCGGKIKIVPKHSTDLIVGENGDLPERANILVTEVFDTELIGEGAFTTFSHAHESLLESDCIVVPSSATIYAQVVESSFAQQWNIFNDVRDDTNGELLLETPTLIKSCGGAAAVHDIQLSQLPVDFFKEIISPQPVLTFNWSKKHLLPPFDRSNTIKAKAKCDGTAQIVFMWWELSMDMENKIILSCAPYWAHPLKEKNPNLTSADIPWRDHWMQALYYLPQPVSVKQSQDLHLISCHDQYSLWFHLDPQPLPTPKNYIKPVCSCGLHITHSRTVIGQLNDASRNAKYISVLKKYVNEESVVLFISDGFYLGLSAAKLGAKKILYLDDNYLSTQLLKEFIKFNRLDNVEIVESTEALANNENIKDVSLICGLPHFATTILPWDGLLFAYLLRKVRNSLSEDVVVAPKFCTIKGIVVEFVNLQKIRLPLESCGEFDMKPFDELILDSSGKCDAKVEAQPLWEYPGIARSSVVELVKLDVETMFSSEYIQTQVQFSLEPKSTYNAVALWADWDLDGTGENVVSAGPVVPPVIGETIQWDMHTKQGVHFIDCKMKEGIYAAFSFNVDEGDINFVFC